MNTKPYWFKRKRYGFGWTPATKEGWIVVGVYLVIVIGGATLLTTDPKNLTNAAIFSAFMIITTGALLVVTYIKGPHPKWRWGKDESHDPESDI